MHKTEQRIIRLEVENLKRVQAVEINAASGLVIIGGENEQGKTSVLDAIEMALGGGKAIPSEPIHKGARKGRVVVETEALVVTRTFTAKGSTLKVESKDGKIFTSPQKMLDALIGSISFDPLAFDRMKPAEQLECLKQVAGLDFAELDLRRESAYAERTGLNRDAKKLTSQIDAMPSDLRKASTDTVSVADLVAELTKHQEANRENEKKRDRLPALRLQAVEVSATITRLKQEITNAEAKLDDIKADGKALAEEVAGLHDKDCQAVRDEIDGAEGVNAKAREALEWHRLSAELDRLSAQSDACSETITEVDEEKQALIESADLPVPGLGFGDGCVMLDGFPLDQASGAQSLKLSVALSAAMSGDLKIALSRDGSLLDKKNLRALSDAVDELGLQLWLERVGGAEDAPGMQVIIDDGLVAEPPFE